MSSLANELEKLAGEATPGPWAYRPDQYDDWGVVKSPPERPDGFEYDLRCVLAQFRDPKALDDETLSAHRAAKTDPWAANAQLVVTLRNNLPAILGALREREAVVAWLRSGGFTRDFGIPWRENLADAIKAGEHMKGEG